MHLLALQTNPQIWADLLSPKQLQTAAEHLPRPARHAGCAVGSRHSLRHPDDCEAWC
jgi:hypothetical protein